MAIFNSYVSLPEGMEDGSLFFDNSPVEDGDFPRAMLNHQS
jgi:hypothetical protein